MYSLQWKDAACRSSIHNRYQFHQSHYIIDIDTTQGYAVHHLGIFSRACCRIFCLFKRTGKGKQAGSAFKTFGKPKWKGNTHSYATLLFLAPCQGQLSVPTKGEPDLLEHCICITLCRVIDVWIIQQVLNP